MTKACMPSGSHQSSQEREKHKKHNLKNLTPERTLNESQVSYSRYHSISAQSSDITRLTVSTLVTSLSLAIALAVYLYIQLESGSTASSDYTLCSSTAPCKDYILHIRNKTLLIFLVCLSSIYMLLFIIIALAVSRRWASLVQGHDLGP